MSNSDHAEDELYEDRDAAFRVGSKIIECAERCAEMDKIVGGAQATWHFTMDDVRFKVIVSVAPPAEQGEG